MLKKILISILAGPALAFGGIMALWENEGRFNYFKAASEAVVVNHIDQLPGEVVAYTGELDASIPIYGEYIKQFNRYITVSRSAQIYSWEESEDSDGDTTWDLGWNSYVENNSRNHGIEQLLRSGDLYPDRFRIDDLVISPLRIHFVDDTVGIPLATLEVTPLSKRLNLNKYNASLYLEKNNRNNLGDERIRYYGIPVEEYGTYFGVIQNHKGIGKEFDIEKSFISDIIGNDGVLHHLVNGTRGEALEKIEAHFSSVKTMTRVGGTIVVIIGLAMFFGNFLGVFYGFPGIGFIVELGVFIASCVLGGLISALVIVLSMAVHNVFSVAFPIALVLVLVVLFVSRARMTGNNARAQLKAKLRPPVSQMSTSTPASTSATATKSPAKDQLSAIELTFVRLAKMAFTDGNASKRERKALSAWGNKQGVKHHRMEELFKVHNFTGVDIGDASPDDLDLLVLMALSDGTVSTREWKVLEKVANSLGVSKANLRETVAGLAKQKGVNSY